MLNEKIQRAVTPAQVASIMPWDNVEAVVVLCYGGVGKPNHLCMSTLTIEELSVLTAQLNAHLNSLLFNSLVEDIPPHKEKESEPANGPDVKN